MRFSDKIVIVTGTAGAIGGAIARAFAREGANLCLADMAPSVEVGADIRSLGRIVIDVLTDVSQKSQVERLVSQAVDRFGRIDVLVAVAGIASTGPAATLTESEWDRVIAINLKGTFLCNQAVIAPMRRQQYGRIVNIGSVIGKNGGNARPWVEPNEQLTASNVAYGVSKAGIHTLTTFLSRELAKDNITVNAVAPGPIATRMATASPQKLSLIPVGRFGTPEEVAEAVLFLAAETSSFITGEILDVNGGLWSD